jgi:hypothetical protein
MTNRDRMKQAIANKPTTPPPPSAEAAPPPPKPKRERMTPARRDEVEQKGRYPENTTVSAVFSGGKWSVTLTVPTSQGTINFNDEASGVHDCLTKLWKAYQEHVRATAPPPPA